MKFIEQPVAEPEKHEQEPTYNFKEIAELEPAMASLVEKLKNKIENGEYDTLISDEVSGRIPTLILRSIIKEKNQERKQPAPKTYYVVGGLSLATKANEGAIKKFFSKIAPEVKKALVVTEYVSSGRSLLRLSQLLEEGGIVNFDLAATYVDRQAILLNKIDDEGNLPADSFPNLMSARKFFSGEFLSTLPELYHVSSELGGVEKLLAGGKVVSPHPFRVEDVKRFQLEKVSPDDLQKIRDDVAKAREDVKTMSARVLSKVWQSR